MNAIPSPCVVEALAQYADLLAIFGPDSQEADHFFSANSHLDQFGENAKNLQQLEKEDYLERLTSRTRESRL